MRTLVKWRCPYCGTTYDEEDFDLAVGCSEQCLLNQLEPVEKVEVEMEEDAFEEQESERRLRAAREHPQQSKLYVAQALEVIK